MSELSMEGNKSQSMTQYIARQPIFNADRSLYAYELLYRESNDNVFPVGTSDGQATGRLFFNALMLMGLEKLTGFQPAFINLSTDAILDDFPKLLQPTSAVIEIVERATSIPQIIGRVKQLKQDGYLFALDDYDGDDKWQDVLPLMDFIKIEAADPIIKTNMTVKKLKRSYPKAKVIVERVESYEDFQQLKAAGCDLFQGYFFAKPELLRFGNVEPSKVAVLELLSCTAQTALNFDQIQQRVAKDIALTARILRLVNARTSSTQQTIRSISQAVIYLGEDAIRQFVRVLALSELGNDKPQELTKLGLTRAKFISLMLEPAGKELSEQGYLVGLLSVLDAILDVKLDAVVKEFSLGAELTSALVKFDGMQGASLQLVIAMEKEQWQTATKLLKIIRPVANMDIVYRAMYDARAYADNVFDTLASVAD
ncbi:EAL and HDOD domain-containing protein [uncultured Pseudoalteromonas sp.]|uniref:EAL and HDOD domain-containing protein n=1 Tax=uncultured Pseudoalteromonas sp. TaxID=114053 RepID=UPI0025F97AEF|nr:HDOD domain-containing protein [uncultured Pseudoalteromonas sp.]|tara:strand:+ start:25699 stop:26976 length:1278 start_codon:yes stop_codon:yes gene_type:complete